MSTRGARSGGKGEAAEGAGVTEAGKLSNRILQAWALLIFNFGKDSLGLPQKNLTKTDRRLPVEKMVAQQVR